jgi:hypothetical protein
LATISDSLCRSPLLPRFGRIRAAPASSITPIAFVRQVAVADEGAASSAAEVEGRRRVLHAVVLLEGLEALE